MPIAGLRFGHVVFKVSDTERSMRWYADAFGATKIYHADAQGERPELMFLEFSKGQCVELGPAEMGSGFDISTSLNADDRIT